MFEKYERVYRSYSNNQTIYRINPKTGATEKQIYNGPLPNELKRQGWKVEAVKGKRVFKTKRKK